MARRDLIKALVTPTPGKYDLSPAALALTVGQYQVDRAMGKALPRPTDIFPSDAFGPHAPTLPFAIDRASDRTGMPQPRVWEYPSGWNLPTPPRALEPVSFQVLRAIAQNVDLVRKAVELIKRELSSVDWDIQVQDDSLLKTKGKDHLQDEKREISRWFERPDRVRGLFWDEWIREAMEEVLVVDALAIYPHPTLATGKGPLGSDLFALEVLDGTLIKPLIDVRGGRPQPPAPAYQQFIYSVARSEYTVTPDEPERQWQAEQLAYKIFNVRAQSIWGYPPTEQVALSAVTYLKRQLWWQAYYTDGDVPAMFLEAGDGWTPDEIERYERALHSLMAADPGWRHRIKMIPHDTQPHPMKPPIFDTDLDHWLATLVAMAFNIASGEFGLEPKAGLGGKGFGEQQENLQWRKSLRPYLRWWENFCTWVIRVYFRQPDLVFRFVGLEHEDAKLRAEIDEIYSGMGAKTINEVREGIGLDARPEAVANEPIFRTKEGAVPLRVVDLQSQGAESAVPGDQQDGAEPAPDAGDAQTGTKELAAFERFASRRLKEGRTERPFQFKTVTPYLAKRMNTALLAGSADLVKAATNAAKAKQLQTSVSQQIAELAEQLEAGEIDEDEFEQQATAALGAAYADAYGLGGGDEAGSWPDESAKDQGSHLEDFATAVAAGMTAEAISSRADLYGGGVWAGFQRGRAASAGKEATITWHAEGDEATCQLCGDRDGEEYTEDTLPGFPGEGDFGEICDGGPNCRCWLTFEGGKGEEE